MFPRRKNELRRNREGKPMLLVGSSEDSTGCQQPRNRK
jgi:hypothetical protein